MNAAIWIGILACVAATFFGACNVALKRFSRARFADVLAEGGPVDSERLARFVLRVPHLVLMTALLRVTLSMIVLLCTLYWLETRFTQWSLPLTYLVAFLIAGALVSVFVVAIPVSWATYRGEHLLARSMPLLVAAHIVLTPVTWLLHLADPVVRRLSGADLQTRDDDELTSEVLSVVEDHGDAGTVDDAQKEMLEAVFDLPTTDVGEIMTPRTEVDGIEVDSTLEQVKQAILELGHSRIPVYQESLDHIVGVLYAKDMIRYVGAPPDAPFSLRDVVREPFLVPESKMVRELLAEFKARKVHMAIVLDEYGGTAGLVTIEDILEEIVGDIQDEYEEAEAPPLICRLADEVHEVDARVRIDQLNDELDLDLPEDEDYDTVGGFVFSQLGHIPDPGEAFDYDGLRFTVTEAERTKVRWVKVEPVASPVDAAASNVK